VPTRSIAISPASRTTIQVGTPTTVQVFVALDWKDAQFVSVQILDASARLHRDSSNSRDHRLIQRWPPTAARPSRLAPADVNDWLTSLPALPQDRHR
jgi:hypothetical protein